MKVKVESPKPWQRVLEVEIPVERVEEEFNSVYETYKRRVAVPGFRKGKVPLSVLQSRFGPKIESEVLSKLLPLAYKEATERENLLPIDQARLTDVQFKRGAPLRFKATVEVKPEVKLVDYIGLKVTKRVKRITDEEVNGALEKLRSERAILSPVDREAKGGDLLIIRLKEEGKEEEELEVELGQGKLLPQFEAQLMGIVKEEEREIEVDYPDTYPEPTYRGRRVKFWVKPIEIKEKRIPELDEFLEELGNFRNLNELKDKLRNDLQVQAEAEAERELREEILDILIEGASLEVPESMIRAYLDHLVTRARQRDKSVDEEEIRNRYRPQAIREISASLILEEIAKRERIEVAAEEVDERVKEIAKSYNMKGDEAKEWLSRSGQLKGLVQRLREEKVFDFLISKGKITTVSV